MSLTIDQILDGCRDDVQTFTFEKQASGSSKVASDNRDTELDQMIMLLKEASIPETNSSPSVERPNFYEKIAEAVILNSVMQTMSEEGEKVAEFREKALQQGHDISKVEAFLEKQAMSSALGKMLKSPVSKKALMGFAGAGAIGAVGAGGYKAGKEKEKKVTNIIGRVAFNAGRKYQYAQDSISAEQRKKIRDYLMRAQKQKASQGSK